VTSSFICPGCCRSSAAVTGISRNEIHRCARQDRRNGAVDHRLVFLLVAPGMP
jgi:hypothetical protein